MYTGRSGGKFEKSQTTKLFFQKVNFGLKLKNPMYTKSLSMCYSMYVHFYIAAGKFASWVACLSKF